MSDYNVQKEAHRILLERIVDDDRLGWSTEIKDACKAVKFVGDPKPFIPTPLKITESASALFALVGVAAASVAKERYGIEQEVTVNSDKATLSLMGVIYPHVNGKSLNEFEGPRKTTKECDIYEGFKPCHRVAIHQCKDGKWYQVHTSLNAKPMMKLLGIEESELSYDETRQPWIDAVKQWNSADLDTAVNDEYRQAGSICNTPEEFAAHPHAKILEKEGMATMRSLPATRKPWPKVTGSEYRPLAGIRVLDVSRAIAAPSVSKTLAFLGADVIKVGCPDLPDTGFCYPDINTGKRDVDINLKTREGQATFKELVKTADVLVDGYRPHALEKLGFHSKSLREINPSLIYVRENCYGHVGPLSYRSGWQQIADAFAGLSWMQGYYLGVNEPVVPLLPNSDYQTGIIGAAYIIQALQKRANADVTFDIDISLLQYNIWYKNLGTYDSKEIEALKARNPGFKARAVDDMVVMFGKMVEAVNISRPGLAQNPDFYMNISGKEWDIDEDISVLNPPIHLSKSELSYLCPSGKRGWSNHNVNWITVS